MHQGGYIPFVDIATELIPKKVWSDVGLCKLVETHAQDENGT